MEIMRGLRGHFAFVVLGIVVLLFLSILPQADPNVYQQLAASAAPSAADQIWEIGNQPIQYTNNPLQQGQIQTQTGQDMWGQNAAFQNAQFTSPVTGAPSSQGDIWSQLNTEVQSSEVQVANNPIPQSTFSGPSDLSSWQAQYDTNNPNLSVEAQMSQADSSWYGSMVDTFNVWKQDAHDFFMGPSSKVIDTPVDTIGIRG